MNKPFMKILSTSVVALLVCGWAIWAWSSTSVTLGSETPKTDESTNTRNEKPLAKVHPASSEERQEVPLPDNTYRLRLQDWRGRAVQGKASWTFHAGKPILVGPLGIEQPGQPAIHDDGQMTFDETLEIPAPEGASLWLRVVTTRSSDREGRESYFLLNPEEQARGQILNIPKEGNTVHVFVLTQDLAANAAGVDVRLFHSPFDGRSQPELIKRDKTDAHGYLRIGDLPSGNLFILAPGAKPGETSKSAAHVILGSPSQFQEYPVVVCRTSTSAAVDLIVDSKLGPESAMPPMLYARQVDDSSNTLIPMKGSLTRGTQNVRINLPDGEFEIAVLPNGAGTVGDGYCLVEVRDGVPHPKRISVHPTRRKITVEFKGLGRADMPFQAWFRRDKMLLNENQRLLFTGPHKWHLTALDIPLPDRKGRWVLWTHRKNWLAQRVAHPSSGTMMVQLEPASRIQVYWRGPGALQSRTTLLMMRSHHGEAVRVMENTLVRDRGRQVPVRLGTAVVPYGSVQITCVEEDGGKLIWSRRIDAQKPWITLDVRD